jgi:hypothetical protein
MIEGSQIESAMHGARRLQLPDKLPLFRRVLFHPRSHLCVSSSILKMESAFAGDKIGSHRLFWCFKLMSVTFSDTRSWPSCRYVTGQASPEVLQEVEALPLRDETQRLLHEVRFAGPACHYKASKQ